MSPGMGLNDGTIECWGIEGLKVKEIEGILKVEMSQITETRLIPC